MALVAVGKSVIDINVDGVTLVAGDTVTEDDIYNLNTDYPARIKVNGGTEYTNNTHNQDTTYDVQASANGYVSSKTRLSTSGNNVYMSFNKFKRLIRIPGGNQKYSSAYFRAWVSDGEDDGGTLTVRFNDASGTNNSTDLRPDVSSNGDSISWSGSGTSGVYADADSSNYDMNMDYDIDVRFDDAEASANLNISGVNES